MKIDGGLRKMFRDKLPMVHWQSIETGGTGRGVPDSNFCYTSIEGWIEFKLTDAFAVNLDPEQVGWILRRKRAGGRVFIAVRRLTTAGPRKGKAVDVLYIFNGAFAKELKRGGLLEPRPLFVSADGCEHWDWNRVLTILLSSA